MNLEIVRVWMSERRTVRNNGMAVAIVVMYSLLGVAVAGSCMWRLLSSILLSGPGFERVTKTPDGTALRTRTRFHAAALQDDSQNDFP